ncbi:hypothetical protein [Desnuesiella massiliensis]|uniref:hypothetical protein n=1 Tax=Desnuesiella massiliensis TaxID=1650662 RepID=UPI000AF08439|nr:hypothetical protein [Desnuesiella massiliensis]
MPVGFFHTQNARDKCLEMKEKKLETMVEIMYYQIVRGRKIGGNRKKKEKRYRRKS